MNLVSINGIFGAQPYESEDIPSHKSSPATDSLSLYLLYPKRRRKSKSILSHASQINCIFQHNVRLPRGQWFLFRFFIVICITNCWINFIQTTISFRHLSTFKIGEYKSCVPSFVQTRFFFDGRIGMSFRFHFAFSSNQFVAWYRSKWRMLLLGENHSQQKLPSSSSSILFPSFLILCKHWEVRLLADLGRFSIVKSRLAFVLLFGMR